MLDALNAGAGTEGWLDERADRATKMIKRDDGVLRTRHRS